MTRHLEATIETFPIAGIFTISRGSKTTAEVVTCTIRQGDRAGRGECVPYRRYGETVEAVVADVNGMAPAIASGMTRDKLRAAMKPGAARNAIDCALWDLEAKLAGQSAASLMGLQNTGLPTPGALTTAFTLSLGTPAAMGEEARRQAARPLLKIKLGTDDDFARLKAVRLAAPGSRIIVDANEGWRPDNLARHFAMAVEFDVALIEQPLPAGDDAALATIERLVPVCADESVHATQDLAALRDRYDAVNIKLDKTGGLTEALRMKAEAERLGFTVMVGCMVGTSLAMAPAVLLAQGCAYADLDGPLLLARDREPALRYEGSLVYPPEASLWG